MGRRYRQHARILAAEFLRDALQVVDLAQRAARGGDDVGTRGRQRRQALALANEDSQPQLVLELADLLADSRLRGTQCLGCARHVETVVDDRAEVLQLLEVHSDITNWLELGFII